MAQTETKKVLVSLSPELLSVLDAIRNGWPRAPLIEKLLWRDSRVQATAAELGIEQPERKQDGRQSDAQLAWEAQQAEWKAKREAEEEARGDAREPTPAERCAETRRQLKAEREARA